MSKPRLHWISPLPPARTDIAHYTRRILPALCREADVTLWTDASSWDPELETFCSVRQFDPETLLPRLMQEHASDPPAAIFAHIGNSWVFHSAILQLTLKLPTVIVLHDVALQEMYLDSIDAGYLDPDEYQSAMQEAYGEEGRIASEKALIHTVDRAALSQSMPLFSLCLKNAQAIVTHTRTASQSVLRQCDVPVYDLDLPFASGLESKSERAADGPLRLVQFGHTGPNRRLEQVLDVLAELQNEIDFTFDVIGSLWDQQLIRDKCNARGLTNRVFLHGYMPEPVLDFALSRAHLVFNLRYPTMGEASGSQLRIWRAAAASVVTNHGWYAEIPEDTAFKIPHEAEKHALADLLRRLASNRHLGVEIGARGHARLQTNHAPDTYAAAITEIARNNETDAHHRAFSLAKSRISSLVSPETWALAETRLSASLA